MSGSCYERALEIQAILNTAGVKAVLDPKAVGTGPAVLIQPPDRIRLSKGYKAVYQIAAIVPGPGDALAWKQLSDLLDQFGSVLAFEDAQIGNYQGRPAAVITLTEIV